MRSFYRVIVAGSALLLSVSAFSWQDVTVKPLDSLGAIADKYRPANVTKMDMVIAIRAANPAIKSQSGFHAGLHLRIPTTATEVRQAIMGKAENAKKEAASKKTSVPKTLTELKKESTPTLVHKKAPISTQAPASSTAATTAQVAADALTIQNLQQALARQNDALQAAQAQIVALSKTSDNNASGWGGEGLFLVLWLATLVLLFRARRRIKCLLQDEEESPILPTERQEPRLHGAEPESQAPQVADDLSDAPAEAPAWEQVELDIPENDMPAQTHIHLEPSLTPEEQVALVGQQQNIINALNDDQDNIEWHHALLEFYVKTDNQNGFNRHLQNMLRKGLIQEGDTLWEEIRKIYLNCWIYQNRDR